MMRGESYYSRAMGIRTEEGFASKGRKKKIKRDEKYLWKERMERR